MNILMTSKDVAERLGVSPYMVRQYVELGLLKGIRTKGGEMCSGQYRFSLADVEDFKARMNGESK